ncbi:ATP-dependent DNA helicase [Trichonephila clavipes]|nr:ATP-dependent DNA helicase [Trichonephila clavipes]
MQANMDIQFVLDEYAVVAYLVDYVNKPGRGLSKILRNCIEATAQGKHSLKECLVSVANQFINSVEISAQEAALSILKLPMCKMSEDTIFIPTFRREDRTRMIKSQERRTKPKVIQYRKFKESQDENEYYRKQMMLFTNWRNENADILIQDFKQLYTTNLETIRSNRKEFVADENLDLEEELMQLEKSRAIGENEEKSEERSLVTFEPALDYDENELVGNISLDTNASHGKGFSIFQPTNKYPDEKYRELVQKCNLKQRDLVQYLQSCLRREPAKRLHWMIQGAAGTRKSFLINIIEQTLIRLFEKPDQDPSQPTVLKLAPTGKAASNIKGETLHHALGIGLSKNARLSGSSITEYAVNIGKIDRQRRGTFKNKKQTILEKVPKSCTLVYHSNHDVDLANKIRLNSIEGPLVNSQAYDSVSGTAPNSSKQKVLDKVRKFDRTKTGNLESVIKFKVGAKYMLTYNIDTADGCRGPIIMTARPNCDYIVSIEWMRYQRQWVPFRIFFASLFDTRLVEIRPSLKACNPFLPGHCEKCKAFPLLHENG